MNSDILPHPDRIDPERFTVLLEEAGWKLVGGRRGAYNRLAAPGTNEEGYPRRGGLVVPLDRSAPEFTQMMSAALQEVRAAGLGELWQRYIAPRIASETADQFQFRRETSGTPGTIPWRQGEELIAAARLTLAAGAKTHVEKMRRYSNRLGRFSNRFLDSVLMGQTSIGSYVVTAYAPTEAPIPIFASTLESAESAPGSKIARGREITYSVAKALEATVEALEHFRTTASLSAFEAGVGDGVSADLSMALFGLADGPEGGDITILWEDAVDLLGATDTMHFSFSPADRRVLERAATYLAGEEGEVVRQTIIGTVHLLTKKEPGAPGVFGMSSVSGPARRARVRLHDEDQYHVAVRAHDQDLVVAVDGRLEKDGNLYWLYDAEIVSVVSTVHELNDRLSGLSSRGTEQLSFEELLESDGESSGA